MSTRRQVLRTLSLGLLAIPFGALADRRGRVWRVGVLASLRRPDRLEDDEHYGEIPRGLRELGYVEGKNLVIEWRFADGRYERFPELARDLVRVGVDVIVTDSTPATLAAMKATATVPIVFGSAGDPVGNGLVKSLSHPGGNVTGISLITTDTAPKQLEMLLTIVPKASRIGVLLNPTNPYSVTAMKGFQSAASIRHIHLVAVEARNETEIEGAFLALIKQSVSAFILTRDRAVFYQQRRQVADLALRHRLPGMGGDRYFPAAGGLMSYGQNVAENYHRAAAYVDKILRGVKAADLPVEQPTKLELVINRKTAKALGLAIPSELLILAEKVIE